MDQRSANPFSFEGPFYGQGQAIARIGYLKREGGHVCAIHTSTTLPINHVTIERFPKDEWPMLFRPLEHSKVTDLLKEKQIGVYLMDILAKLYLATSLLPDSLYIGRNWRLSILLGLNTPPGQTEPALKMLEINGISDNIIETTYLPNAEMANYFKKIHVGVIVMDRSAVYLDSMGCAYVEKPVADRWWTGGEIIDRLKEFTNVVPTPCL